MLAPADKARWEAEQEAAKKKDSSSERQKAEAAAAKVGHQHRLPATRCRATSISNLSCSGCVCLEALFQGSEDRPGSFCIGSLCAADGVPPGLCVSRDSANCHGKPTGCPALLSIEGRLAVVQLAHHIFCLLLLK